MKLSQIRHVVAVAERGSLQSAADQLGVSTDTVVRSIRTLERELGTALFTRGQASMTPTPAGAIFVRRAAAAQAALDRASEAIGRTPGEPGGRVAIGLSASLDPALLPAVLGRFRARFGDVRVRLVESDGVGAVRDGLIDFFVGPVGPQQHTPGLAIDQLYHAARLVVARQGHPLAGAVSLAELAEARWIAASPLELETMFEEHGLPPPVIAVEAPAALAMLSAAASDALVMVAASRLSLIGQAGLAILPLRDLPDLSIRIVTRTLPLSPAAAYLHELIVAAAGDLGLASRPLDAATREDRTWPG